MCCTCKVAFLLIRPIVVFHRSPALPSPLSITLFYILFEQTINIIESFAFSPGEIYILFLFHEKMTRIIKNLLSINLPGYSTSLIFHTVFILLFPFKPKILFSRLNFNPRCYRQQYNYNNNNLYFSYLSFTKVHWPAAS